MLSRLPDGRGRALAGGLLLLVAALVVAALVASRPGRAAAAPPPRPAAWHPGDPAALASRVALAPDTEYFVARAPRPWGVVLALHGYARRWRPRLARALKRPPTRAGASTAGATGLFCRRSACWWLGSSRRGSPSSRRRPPTAAAGSAGPRARTRPASRRSWPISARSRPWPRCRCLASACRAAAPSSPPSPPPSTLPP